MHDEKHAGLGTQSLQSVRHLESVEPLRVALALFMAFLCQMLSPLCPALRMSHLWVNVSNPRRVLAMDEEPGSFLLQILRGQGPRRLLLLLL